MINQDSIKNIQYPARVVSGALVKSSSERVKGKSFKLFFAQILQFTPWLRIDKSIIKNRYLLVLWLILSFRLTFAQQDQIEDFCSSFVNSYDLSGRYTHEYHPFILDRAKESFLKLQDYLQSNGYKINGHEIVLGYQEDAIVPYQTQWNRILINDEAVVKKHAGLCSPVKNLFGFVTGFLLKDAQWMYNRWYPGVESKIEHVTANPIELFNDYAVIFQKHAFGKDFDYFIKVRNSLERSIYKDDIKTVLSDLVNFWTSIYEHFSRSGSNEVIATQDLVFSIDYAKALLNDSVNIKKVFLGPDITYPIEILAFQKQRATANAQKFVQQFVNRIEPVDGENTAYFFCSYVDGVGKSTLLNNIKNYQLYGFDLDKYARCDNSSSQYAEIYGLKEGVFLVDMPAQMSHFVAKPDGYVFADIDTIKDLKSDFCARAAKYISKNQNNLTNAFLKIKKSIEVQDLKLYESDNPIEQYAHNCVLLNPKSCNDKDEQERPKWIPCEFENRFILFSNDRKSLKVLTPISETHSKGLKEVIPEMMLFSKGVSFPKPYDDFLADLNTKLADAHIKNVVFVDFLSMYPRSSRENVRLNFMMQYLTKIFKSDQASFDIDSTMYQHKVYPEQEIFYKLSNVFDSVRDNFVFETALRWALFELTNSDFSLKIDSPVVLEEALYDIIYKFIDQHGDRVQEIVTKKLENEKELYSQKYLLDKVYENVVKFKFEPLLDFSDVLINLFKNGIENQTLNFLWKNLDSEIKDIDNMAQIATLLSGEQMEIKYKIHISAREQDVVNEIIRTLRAQWYASLENLMHGVIDDGKIIVSEIKQNVPPLVLKRVGDYIYVLQKRLPLLDVSNKKNSKTTKPKLTAPIRYHLMDGDGMKKRWGLLDDVPYCLDWENIGTFFGIFAHGYFPFNLSKDTITKTIENYKLLCIKNDHQEWGITISYLLDQAIGDKDIKQIKKDGLNKEKLTVLNESDSKIQSLRLWSRMIATLDMIAKDFSSEILIRKGDKQDFIASLKLLDITLAKYYFLDFDFTLFDDYESQVPVISWDKINNK